ncbi:MAG: FKBP-type peptidyl-prolyl cis-trans isomerase [Parcubacteria group bacterium]|nr:FKBP-type peptidyl-prolyl cis-trans isomerase [Parcubacteria group bacterium]
MNRQTIATFIILILIAALVYFVATSKPPAPTGSPSPSPVSTGAEDTTTFGLQVEDLVVGTGAEAKNGDTLEVHYVGTLTNGVQFDSSYSRGQPFTFTLGQEQVIQGWDQGLLGMKVGGKRKLTIPPELGYGPVAQGLIPPNSTLIFEVDLLKVN